MLNFVHIYFLNLYIIILMRTPQESLAISTCVYYTQLDNI